MKQLLVQEYLRSGKTLGDLEREHGVEHRISNGKISLNYDQISSKSADKLACECRGLILREKTYDAVAIPFFRFFNFGEGSAADIDWNTARFYDKMDGTLIIAYFDKLQNKWHCATRKVPEADQLITDANITFAQLVEKAIGTDLNSFMRNGSNTINQDWKNYTFCFELCSPYNRVVCNYEDTKLYLLAVKDISTLEELPIKTFAECLDVETPREFSFNGIENAIEIVRTWAPLEQEGIVAIDDSNNRNKVKNPAYMAYNRMHDSLSTSWRGIVEVVLLGQEDDLIPMMPNHISKKLVKVKDLVRQLFTQTEKDYEELKNIDDMKSFALEATKRIWSAPLFAIKRNKASSIKDFILGGDKLKNGIASSTLDSILGLCEKIDPTLKDI